MLIVSKVSEANGCIVPNLNNMLIVCVLIFFHIFKIKFSSNFKLLYEN